MMKEQLEAIRKSALEAIAGTKAAAELDALRVKYLGKKGELTAVLKLMGSLSAEERPVMGQMANEVRHSGKGRSGSQAEGRDAGRHHPRQGGGSGPQAPHVHRAG